MCYFVQKYVQNRILNKYLQKQIRLIFFLTKKYLQKEKMLSVAMSGFSHKSDAEWAGDSFSSTHKRMLSILRIL